MVKRRLRWPYELAVCSAIHFRIMAEHSQIVSFDMNPEQKIKGRHSESEEQTPTRLSYFGLDDDSVAGPTMSQR